MGLATGLLKKREKKGNSVFLPSLFECKKIDFFFILFFCVIIYGCVMFASYFALIGKREKQKICPNAIYFLPCRFLYKKRQFSRNGFHGKFCFFRLEIKKKKHYLIEVRQNPVNLSKGRRKKILFFQQRGKKKEEKLIFFMCPPSLSSAPFLLLAPP